MAKSHPRHKQPPATKIEPVQKSPQAFLPGWARLRLFLPAIVGGLLYAFTTTNHGFVLDDNLVITSNEHVLAGWQGIPDLLRYNYGHGHNGFNDGLYRPLSLVTFAAEQALFGEIDPGRSHVIQAILYALLLLLLMLWLQALFPTGNGAFWMALLFAVHPIHSEVVANLKSRDELMALMFFSASAWAFVKHLRQGAVSWLIAAWVAFVLALFSKESVVALSAVFPLMHWYTSPERGMPALRRIGVKAAMMATATVLFLVVRSSVLSGLPPIDTGVANVLQNSLMDGASMAERVATVARIQGLYFTKLFVPVSLSHDYSFNAIPVVGLTDVAALLWIAFLAALLVFGGAAVKQKRTIGFGIAFYFISMVVVANLFRLIGAMAAERFLFTPSLGWSIAVVVVLEAWRIPQRWKHTVPLALCTGFAMLTLERIPDWKDELSLYTTDVVRVPQSARAHYNAGSALNNAAKADPTQKAQYLPQAITHLRTATEIWPEYQDAHNNLGIALMESGDFEGAYRVLKELLVRYPEYTKGDYNMGVTCLRLNRSDEAEAYFERFFAANPLNDALLLLAEAEGNQQKFDEAIEHLLLLTQREPERSRGWLKLGMAYAMSGQMQAAGEAMEKAQEREPDNVEIMYNRCIFYLQTGQREAAENTLKRALQLHPNDPNIRALQQQMGG